MAFDKGFNFRATSSYVTDGTNETYVLSADTYPTVRNGATFGWTTSPTAAVDRSTSVDRRLAGVHYSNGTRQFKVDLPATGDYTIRMAMGDELGIQITDVVLRDNATVLVSFTEDTLSPDRFKDASDVNWTGAAWPGSNVAITKTFATTSLVLAFGSRGHDGIMTHLFVSQAAATGGPFPFFMDRQMRGGMRGMGGGL